MEFLAQYGLFALKTLTIIIGFLLLFAGILSLGRRHKSGIQIESLNEAYEAQKKQLYKSLPHHAPEKPKKKKKKKSKTSKAKNTRFVLSFNGDIRASAVTELRNEISMILSVATPKDEVVLCLESPGGAVSGYGLAASQLARLKEKNIPLTVCIDKVAASGGYLMASIADQIIAAPFAIIGSIGVVVQLPNFHRLLKKNNIDIEQLTAGQYKRTLTMLGENSKKGREKMQEDIEAIHHIFQSHLLAYRKQLDMEKVATGEHWLAKDAIELNLVDALQTSDDYIYNSLETFETVKLTTPVQQALLQKLTKPVSKLFMESHLPY